MKQLIREIHRRSLWQVLGIYLVASWAALQVVDVFTDNFGLPEWFPAFAVALLVIGLPIVLATAFVQDSPARPAGDSETETQEAAAGAAPGGGVLTWRFALVGAVGASLLWGGVAVGWVMLRGDTAVATEEAVEEARSIAVLPFATRSSVEEDVFFADGMHDDLLTQLSRIEALTVISRTSVEKYRNTDMSIPDIAAELGVNTIMEGGIQRAGNRVRVNMQLIEAPSDRHLWADTYDEELTAENVFRIQSDLTQRIADALAATLSPDEVQRITSPRAATESLEAFDLVAHGQYILQGPAANTREGVEESIALFTQATVLDDAYADAWVGLADAYGRAAGLFMPGEQANPLAVEAIDRALTLEPDHAEGLSRRGLMRLFIDEDPEGAEADFQRALELAPGSALILGRYSSFLQNTDRSGEALAVTERLVELDPLSLQVRLRYEEQLWNVGRFEESLNESLKTLRMEPDDISALYNLGWSYGMLDRVPEAVEAFERALRVTPDEDYLFAALAWAHARGGSRESALSALARISPEGLGGYDRALVHFELGDIDTAFEALEEIMRTNPGTHIQMASDISTAEMREHPRYGELLETLGLEG